MPGPQFAEVAGLGFFTAFGDAIIDGIYWRYGTELFYTSGTGVMLARDICPGECSSAPLQLTAVPNSSSVYFTAYHPSYGRELWWAGEYGSGLVTDFTPGSSSTDLRELTYSDGVVYFTAPVPPSGAVRGLYAMLGSGVTRLGTVENPSGLRPVGGFVYFNGTDANGKELWRTDGTISGTVRIADVNQGSPSGNPRSIVGLADDVYFVANNGKTGDELFKYSAATGTVDLVKELVPFEGTPFDVDTDPQLTVAGNRVFFQANVSGFGRELWSTDGTAVGTELVTDIVSGPGHSTPNRLTAVGSWLYFTANSLNEGRELWRTNSDVPAAELVKDIHVYSGSSNPSNFVVVGTGLYFSAFDGLKTELWLADAHLEGARTPFTSPINPSGSSESIPFGYFRTGGRLLVSADDGVSGPELWSVDARRAVSLDYLGSPLTVTSSLATVNGKVVFGAYTDVTGEDVFVSDGVTVSELEVQHGVFSAYPSNFKAMGSSVFLSAYHSQNGNELFVTDGQNDPVLVEDICTNACSSDPMEPVDLGGKLFFTADDGSGRRVYWTSGSGAFVVPGTYESPWMLTKAGSKLFFLARDGQGEELWTYDPGRQASPNVAYRVSQIGAAADDALITEMVDHNGILYFAAGDLTNPQLYRSTGAWGSMTTTAITTVIGGLSPRNMKSITIGSTRYLFFSGTSNGVERMFRLSGTLTALTPVGDCSGAHGITLVGPSNPQVYFACSTPATGLDLWRVNSPTGSAPTISAVQVNPGSGSSNPVFFGTANGRNYLSADDGFAGNEPFWVTAATFAPRSQHDLVQGPVGSHPKDLVPVLGGNVFVANDGVRDTLWFADNL